MSEQDDAIAWAEAIVGRTVDARYQLEKVLGAGGMGAVFEAYDQQTDAFVAIKLVLPAIAANTDGIARFHREAQSASRVGAKGVAAVLAVGSDPQLGPYIVMECLVGESLVDRLRRERALEASTTVVIVRDLLEALALVHAAGIIHRDLKPGNVFLVEDAGRVRVKIVDFGVCRVDQQIARTMLTAPGEVLGTPHYMSPEQAAGKSDERADLYSVGAIAYSCLAGRPPYSEAVGMAAVARLVVEPPTPLRRIVPQLDELLLWFVERAMARNPNDRFSSADEMLEALERFEVDATRVDHRMEERLSVDDAIPNTAQHDIRDKPGAGMIHANGIDPTAFDDDVQTVAEFSPLGAPATPAPRAALPHSPFAPGAKPLVPRKALPSSPFAAPPGGAQPSPAPLAPRPPPPQPAAAVSASAPQWPAPSDPPVPKWASAPPGVAAPARISSGPRVQAFEVPPAASSAPPPPSAPSDAVAPTALMPASGAPPPMAQSSAVAPTALMPVSGAPPPMAAPVSGAPPPHALGASAPAGAPAPSFTKPTPPADPGSAAKERLFVLAALAAAIAASVAPIVIALGLHFMGVF